MNFLDPFVKWKMPGLACLATGCLLLTGATLQAETTPSKPKQRSGSVKADITLDLVQKALADADATPAQKDPDQWQRINKLLRSMPDDVCPAVADLTLNLKSDTLWKPAVRQAFAEWSLFDGAAAAKRIEAITDPQRKDAAWGVVVQVWRQRNVEACWAYLMAMPDSVTRDKDMRHFLESYSFKDPKRTLEFAAMVKNPAVRQDAMEEVAWHWAEKDAPAALAWVNTLPDTAQKEKAIRRVVLGVTSRDKRQGAALAMSLPDAKLAREMVNEVHQLWAHADLQAALDAFLKLPPELQDTRTAQNFGYSTDKLDADAILHIAEQLTAAKDSRDVFLQRAASRKETQGRTNDAIRLLDKIQAENPRTQGYRNLAMNWAAKDTTQATAWVTALPATPEREQAIEGLTWGLLPGQPEQALVWSAKLSSKEAAANLRKNLYANWARKNEAAARAWLDTKSGLSEAEKQEYFQQAELAKSLHF